MQQPDANAASWSMLHAHGFCRRGNTMPCAADERGPEHGQMSSNGLGHNCHKNPGHGESVCGCNLGYVLVKLLPPWAPGLGLFGAESGFTRLVAGRERDCPKQDT